MPPKLFLCSWFVGNAQELLCCPAAIVPVVLLTGELSGHKT
uniref:Uncharacterized protein n=1 Tax=Arundo donax TaxID=35708 RepID=A0A0A9GZI4_ARUDO